MPELITVKEIVTKYGLTENAVHNRISRFGIKPVKIEALPNENNGRKYRIRFYDIKDIMWMLGQKQNGKKPAKKRSCNLWKVSVFDFTFKHYIVKAVSLTHRAACEMRDKLQGEGWAARCTPHLREV